MTRSRLLLRVEHPDGVRTYWNPCMLSGHGRTLDEARADHERRMRELEEDGLEVVGRMTIREESSAAHGGASNVPTDWHYGPGLVEIQVRETKKKR